MNRKELILNVVENPLIKEFLDKDLLSKRQLVEFVLLETPTPPTVPPTVPPAVPAPTGEEKEKLTQIFQAMALALPHLQKLKQAIEKIIPVMKAPTTAPVKTPEKYAESQINEQTKEITDRAEIVKRLEKSEEYIDIAIEQHQEAIKDRESLTPVYKDALIKAFDLKNNKKFEDFVPSASPGWIKTIGIAAYMMTQIKPQYQMIKNLISKVGGGRVTYDTGKIDTQMQTSVIDKIKTAMPEINTEAGVKAVADLTTEEYFAALKHNLRNGIPIRGYLKSAGPAVPEPPEEITEALDTDEFLESVEAKKFGNQIQGAYGAFQASSRKLEKRIDNMMALYGTEGQITSKSFFNFFENLKTLAKESEDNELHSRKLMGSLNKIRRTGKKIVVNIDGKRYVIDEMVVQSPHKRVPRGKADIEWGDEETSPPKIEKWTELFKLLPDIIKSLKDQGREQIEYQKVGDMSKATYGIETISRLIKKDFEDAPTVEFKNDYFGIFGRPLISKGEVDTHTILPLLNKQKRLLDQNYKPEYFQKFKKLAILVHKTLKGIVKARKTPPTSVSEHLERKLETIIEQMLQGKYG